MKNITTKIIAICAISLTTISCKDYLSYDENRMYTEEYFWSNYGTINQYLTATYEKLPGTFMYVGSAFLDCSTDNAEHNDQSSNINLFNMGTNDAFSSINSGWDDSFKGIRLANTLINNIDTVTLVNEQVVMADRTTHERALERFKGEARFLKAYFYFELFKRYGEIPIVDDWVSDVEPLDSSRRPISEVINHISNTLDDALIYLPTKSYLTTYSEYSSTLGHAIQGAAYALKSRAFLYAASPLFSDEGSAQSVEYYTKAIEASLMLINNTTDYSLVSNYADLFVPNGSTAFSNSEVIFDRRSTTGYALETNNHPVGFYSANGLTNPSQDLVDAYEMSDGTVFDWDNPAHAAAPYEGRDARFEATILYNGYSMLDRTVETFTGGLDADNDYRDGTRTGYYLKKFIDITVDLNDPTGKRHYWPIFRLSEIYLNYAEAMNELYGPSSDPEGYGLTAIEALNVVRNRAGQPNIESVYDVLTTQEVIREKIRNERRIEFAFEDHRHWDLRRWKAGEGTLNGMLHGVKITRSIDETAQPVYTYDEEGNIESTTFDPFLYDYEVTEVEQRVFDTSYMYLYPIPSSEILWSEPMEQNPGW